MLDITPRSPQQRPLLWHDDLLTFQEIAREVVSRLNIDTFYLVGGAVRDALLHRPVKDIDLVTAQDSIRLARELANALNGDVFIIDPERGGARLFWTIHDSTYQIDLTRYRAGETLLEDLIGRDFTINAMAVDLLGNTELLIDPLGGEHDLIHKQLRLCTPQAIENDPIRGLRAVRQSAHFGWRILPETRVAIEQNAHRLMQTSGERVRDELFSLLKMSNVVAGLRVAYQLGLLTQIFPEMATWQSDTLPEPHVFTRWEHTLFTLQKYRTLITALSPNRDDSVTSSFAMGMITLQLNRFRVPLREHYTQMWANQRAHTSLVMLAALLHATPSTSRKATVARCAEQLKLSAPEKKQLLTMVMHYESVLGLNTQNILALHRYWYELRASGIDTVLLAMMYYLGVYGATLDQAKWLSQVDALVRLFAAYFEQYDTIVLPIPLVNGKQLMEILNKPEGEWLRYALKGIREGQVTGTITTPQEAIGWAKERLEAGELG